MGSRSGHLVLGEQLCAGGIVPLCTHLSEMAELLPTVSQPTLPLPNMLAA